VFISYSQRDRDYVRALVAHLQSHGVTVWFDENLHAGTSQWVKSIEGAIEGSIAVIPVMSTESDGSVWVDRELDLAQELRKPIVPLLLSGRCFLRLRDRQFEDVTTGQMPGMDFIRQLNSPPPEIPRPVTVAPPAQPSAASLTQVGPTTPATPMPPVAPMPQPIAPMPQPTQPVAQQPMPMPPVAPPTQPIAQPQPTYAYPPTGYPPVVAWPQQPQPGYIAAPQGLVPIDRAKSWATQAIWWSLAGLCTGITLIVGWVFAIKALNESRRTGLSMNRVYVALGMAALITGAFVVIVVYSVVTANNGTTA
jgi:hypothetical protein